MTGFLPVLPDRGCSLPLLHAYLGQAPRCFLSPRRVEISHLHPAPGTPDLSVPESF